MNAKHAIALGLLLGGLIQQTGLARAQNQGLVLQTPPPATTIAKSTHDDACVVIRDLTRAARYAKIANAEQAILEATRKRQAEFNDMGLAMTFVCPETGRQFPVDWHKGKAEGNAVFDASAAITQRDIDKARALTLSLLKRHGLKHPNEMPARMEAAWAQLPPDARTAYETVGMSIANAGDRHMGNRTRFASDSQFETESTEAPLRESSKGSTKSQSGRVRTEGETVVQNVHSTTFQASIRNHSPLAIKGLRGRLLFIDNYDQTVGESTFETMETIQGHAEQRVLLEAEDPVFAPVEGRSILSNVNAKMREMQVVLLYVDLIALEDGTKIKPSLQGIETPQEAQVVVVMP